MFNTFFLYEYFGLSHFSFVSHMSILFFVLPLLLISLEYINEYWNPQFDTKIFLKYTIISALAQIFIPFAGWIGMMMFLYRNKVNLFHFIDMMIVAGMGINLFLFLGISVILIGMQACLNYFPNSDILYTLSTKYDLLNLQFFIAYIGMGLAILLTLPTILLLFMRKKKLFNGALSLIGVGAFILSFAIAFVWNSNMTDIPLIKNDINLQE